jgi:hypothetical protein
MQYIDNQNVTKKMKFFPEKRKMERVFRFARRCLMG